MGLKCWLSDSREEQESQLDDVLDIKEFLFNFYERSLFNDPLCLPRQSDRLSILLND